MPRIPDCIRTKCMVETFESQGFPWLLLGFLVGQILFVLLDVSSDLIQAKEYKSNNHIKFFAATLTLVFAPFILSLIIDFVLPTLNDKSNGDLEIKFSKERLLKSACHLPFIQVLHHSNVLYKMFLEYRKMSAAVESYKELELEDVFRKSEDEKAIAKNNISECAKSYYKSSQAYKKHFCQYQEAQLYDKFGEDGPQFALQLAIVLKFGYFSHWQILTITTSFIGFAVGSINIYTQLPTKYSVVRDKAWQDQVILGACFFVVIVSRVFSLCLAISYLNAWVFFGMFAYIGISFLILWLFKKDTLMRDPKKSILGVITNIFSPCIAANEYDNFLLISSHIATFCHLLLQLTLFFLVYSSTLQPAPENDPPILHCFFDHQSPNESRTHERCPYEVINGNLERKNNCTTLLTTALNETSKYITFCNSDMKEWTLLLHSCGVVGALLLLNFPITYFLQWYLSPIWRYKVSRRLFSQCSTNLKREHLFIAPILNQLFDGDGRSKKERYKNASSTLKQRLNGKSLLQWSLEEEHFLFSEHLLNDYEAEIEEADWKAVVESGRVEGLDIVLRELIRRKQLKQPNESVLIQSNPEQNSLLENSNQPKKKDPWVFDANDQETKKALRNFDDKERIKEEGEFWQRLGRFQADRRADELQFRLSIDEDHVDGDRTEIDGESGDAEDEDVPPSVLYELQKLANVNPQEGIKTCTALKLNAGNMWLMEQGAISIQ